jgi:hypothetical protein
MEMAFTGQRASHRAHPVQRCPSCKTTVLRQAMVSKANKGRGHAAMQRPQPEQRAASTDAIC